MFDARAGAPLQVNREARRIVDALREPAQSPEQLLGVVTVRRAGETVWAELGRRILAGGPAFTTALGLGGVQLVTSDRLSGAEDAIATVFPGASWQRCRTHFLTNPLSKVPPPLTASSCRRHRRSAPHGDINDAARRGSLINQRGWRSYTT